MANNLQMYHSIVGQLRQWLPGERITRLRTMALLLVGLQQSGSVHLGLIVRKWPGVVGKLPSLVNRLHRLLCNPRVGVRRWYHPLAQSLVERCSGGELRLVMDITKVGFNHRLLTISLAYKRRTLPLVWSVHRGRKGNISYKHQLALLEYVRQLVPSQAVVWVIADAGFEAVPLKQWLTAQRWHFVLRLPGKDKVRGPGQPWIAVSQIPLAQGQTRPIGWVELTEKHAAGPFWLLLHWDKHEDEPWYLIADVADARLLLRHYRVRMWTEEMYGDMKGHGFDLEATHLTHADRIDRLVLAVCLTFVWLLTLGSWVVKRGLRHLLDHKSRRDKSYFRLGWDWVEDCFRRGQPVHFHCKPFF
jgi:hypothetical protein